MDIDIKNLAYQLLPPHKRLPIRLRWLSALLLPLAEQWTSFCAWRTASRMLVNVNSQTAVLEGYLRTKYHEPTAIKIESYEDGLPTISLANESEDRQVLFHKSEDESQVPEIPLSQEIRNRFKGDGFLVYIPEHLDRTLVEAEIDRYKQALITYRLVQAKSTDARDDTPEAAVG